MAHKFPEDSFCNSATKSQLYFTPLFAVRPGCRLLLFSDHEQVWMFVCDRSIKGIYLTYIVISYNVMYCIVIFSDVIL